MKQSYLSLLFFVLIPFVFCVPTTHLEDELLSVLFSTRNSDTEFITLDDLYHVNHLTKDMDMENLVSIFETADKNKDGKVYYEELIFFVKVDFAESIRVLNTTFVSDSSEPIPQTSEEAYPAVLIPGLTGTVLTNGGNTRYWMDTWQMLLGLYKTNLAVEWNGNAAVSKKSVTAVQGPNGVRSIGVDIMPYMNVLLDSLASSGVDAATYDWRMPPQSPYIDNWITNLKSAVTGLKQAKNKKVFLIAHSLGNIMTMSLFNRSSEQQWVLDNIAGFIAVAPPFGGSGMPIEAMLTGMAVKDPISFRIPADFIQKLPSIPLLAPYSEVFGDTVVLTHKGQSYTAGQFFKFLKDNVPAAAKSTVPMYENLVVPLGVDYLSAVPPVPVWLITCETEATVLGINYVSASDYTQILESQQPYGDSIVPFISLHANDKKWQLVEGKTDIRIPGATHNNIVSNPTFIQEVKKILSTFQN